MGRTIAGVALGLALAAGLAYALLDWGQATEYANDWSAQEASGDAELGQASLEGMARAHTAESRTARTGTFAIEGHVRNAQGEPLAGVRVTASYSGVAWDQADPSTWNVGPERWIRKQIEAVRAAEPEIPTIDAETTSAADGTFALAGLAAGRYTVRAWSDPPRIGTVTQAQVVSHNKLAVATLYVLDGSTLRGRVLGANDEPISATLAASWSGKVAGADAQWDGLPLATDAASGGFVFPAVPSGTLRIALIVPGRFRSSGTRVETPHEGELIVRIDGGGGAIHGTVTDAKEDPVVGAELLISVRGEKGPDETGPRTAAVAATTDADGRFRVEGVPPGTIVSVQGLADGFLTLAESPPKAPWSGATLVVGDDLALDLRMNRGGVVQGRVLDAETRAPLASAEVRLYAVQSDPRMVGPSAPRSTTTDAAGRYRFDKIATGRHVLLPSHATHYLPALATTPSQVVFVPGRSTAGPPEELTFAMPPEAITVERDLTLKPGLKIRGRVVDGEGNGVVGAAIRARGNDLQQVAWQWGIGYVAMGRDIATSKANGEFEVASLFPKAAWVLFARKEGFAGVYGDAVGLAEGEQAPYVTLRLAPGATVRGTVFGPEGTGVAQAMVHLQGTSGELASGQTWSQTSADGTFEIGGLSAGTYTLYVNRSQGGGAEQIKVEDLRAGEVREGIEVRFTAGVAVSGLVVDESGKPVPRLSLLLQPPSGGAWFSATTDADGGFVFENVAEGLAQIRAGSSQTPLGGQFEVPCAELRLTYAPPASVLIQGRVLDPVGKPVPLCTVDLGAAADGDVRFFGGPAGFQVTDGAFERTVKGKPPYRITVTGARGADGKLLHTKRKLVTLQAAPKEPVEIRLEAGEDVRGSVTDPAGEPVARVVLAAGASQATTDAQGRFHLQGLDSGTVTIEVQVPPGFVRPPSTAVRAGSTDVEIRLQKGLSISGTVLLANGEPVGGSTSVSANWKATARSPAGYANGTVDPTGTFSVSGIPEDVLVGISISPPWEERARYAAATADDVRPGTDDLDLRFEEGLTITGVVVDAKGRPLANGFVVASTRVGNHTNNWAQLKKGGRFELGGLRPEIYRLVLQRQDNGPVPPPLEVRAPATGVRIELPDAKPLSGKIRAAGPNAETFSVRAWREGTSWSDGVSGKVTADGRFTVGKATSEGRWMIAVYRADDDRYGITGPVEAGASDVVVSLTEGARITGVVEDNAGRPVSGAWVRVSNAEWSRWSSSKDDGTFEVCGLPPGTFTVAAGLRNTATQAKQERIEAGASDVRVRLP